MNEFYFWNCKLFLSYLVKNIKIKFVRCYMVSLASSVHFAETSSKLISSGASLHLHSQAITYYAISAKMPRRTHSIALLAAFCWHGKLFAQVNIICPFIMRPAEHLGSAVHIIGEYNCDSRSMTTMNTNKWNTFAFIYPTFFFSFGWQWYYSK